MRLGNESKRYDPREEALSRETCTGRGTVFGQFPFTIVAASRQRVSERCVHLRRRAPGNKASSRDAYFSRTRRLPWCTEKRGRSANISTPLSPSTRKAILFFSIFKNFLRLPRYDRLAEWSKVKIERLSSFPPLLRQKRSAVTTYLRYGTWRTSETLRPPSLAKSRLCKMEDVRLVVGRFFVAFKLVNWRRYCNSAAQLLLSCLHSKLYSRRKWSRIK